MPTDTFVEITDTTGYQTRVGAGAITSTVTTAVKSGRDATGSATEYRGYISYDTSTIPDDATLTSAELGVYVTSVTITGTPTPRKIYIHAAWDTLGASLDSADWNAFPTDTLVGNLDDPSSSTMYTFALDPPADYINLTGTTEFRLRKTETISLGQAYTIITETSGVTRACYLTVTYTLPSGQHVVQTFGGVCG